MSQLQGDYFWRDGFFVRRPRTVYRASYIDAKANQPLFTAESTNLTKLIEFNDHVQQVLDDVAALGLAEHEPQRLVGSESNWTPVLGVPRVDTP